MTHPPSKRLGFKPSHADNKRAIQQSLGHLAIASGKPTPAHQLEIATSKPKQSRKPAGSDGRKLEADVQREIIAYLLQHPAVAMVERINSGAVYGTENQFIRFHHLMIPHHLRKAGVLYRVVDLNVMLLDGKRMAVECKREGWQRPNGVREIEQANYLAHIRKCGGIGIFATSVEDVRVALIAAGYGE